MASAGDRLQIVIGAKDELSAQLRGTRKELTNLGRTANDMQRRMEAGEQGLQNEYEQTRRSMDTTRRKLGELQQQQRDNNREFKRMTDEGHTASMRLTRSFDKVSKQLGLTEGKAATLRRGLERLDDNADNFGRRWSAAFGKADRSMDRTRRSGGVMAAGWGKVAGAAAVVTGAVMATSSAFNVLSGSIEEARGARKAAAQTAAVMRSMGRTEAPAAVDRMVNRLEKMSGIDGDNLREMTNIMFTFGNVTGKTFTTANELALDLSVAFGKDLSSSAVMVGKALNNPAKGLTALSRIGVSFTTQQTEQVKAMMEVGDIAGAQKIILAELSKQVSGSAAAQADSISKTSVAWGNLKEAVGDVLLDTSTGIGLTKGLQDATKWIKQHKKDIISVLQGIMSVVFKLISVFLKWQSVVIGVLGYVVGAFAKVLSWAALLDPSLQGVADGANSLAKGFGDASDAANRSSTYFDSLSTKAGDASRKTKQLADALRDVDSPKKIRFVIETVVQGFTGLGVGAPVDGALAAGGPVLAGNTYLVGEIGPELFVSSTGATSVVGADGPEIRDFHTSGTIIPNVAVSAYVAASREPAMAAAPSGGVQIGELHVHDRFDARREFEAMMARQRRIAAERS
ncbi:MAG: hypothetical protein IPN92_21000 [Chromatiaceae bacterium]|nr:hypothetical protein [Chromatiaceae bacterium]